MPMATPEPPNERGAGQMEGLVKRDNDLNWLWFWRLPFTNFVKRMLCETRCKWERSQQLSSDLNTPVSATITKQGHPLPQESGLCGHTRLATSYITHIRWWKFGARVVQALPCCKETLMSITWEKIKSYDTLALPFNRSSNWLLQS